MILFQALLTSSIIVILSPEVRQGFRPIHYCDDCLSMNLGSRNNDTMLTGDVGLDQSYITTAQIFPTLTFWPRRELPTNLCIGQLSQTRGHIRWCAHRGVKRRRTQDDGFGDERARLCWLLRRQWVRRRASRQLGHGLLFLADGSKWWCTRVLHDMVRCREPDRR